jgi:hypothetical protein
MNKRICEILINNEWIKSELKNVKAGDIFRLFDDNVHVTYKGNTEFKACSDAYLNDSNIYTVNYE